MRGHIFQYSFTGRMGWCGCGDWATKERTSPSFDEAVELWRIHFNEALGVEPEGEAP